MLKPPRPGLVKTRLAQELPGGADDAVAIYRRLVERQWRALPDWPKVIHFTPVDAVVEMRAWLPDADAFLPQPNGDLGARLFAAVESALARGAPSVILIGGDCPGLDRCHFEESRERLTDHDYVIGPAIDGGYTLLAVKERLPRLFTEMPWSTNQIYRLTRQRAAEAGWRGHALEALEDVDDLASWERLRHLL